MKRAKKASTIDRKLLERVREPTLCPQLHPYLREFTGYCMLKAAMRIRAKVDTGMEHWGLVAPHFGILTILAKDGPLTQIELGKYMAIDKATMVRFLDTLEEKGFVTRTTSASDRRAKKLEVTKSGLAAMKQMEIVRREAEESVLNLLTSQEREQLKKIVQKLVSSQD